jgi:hypothetical protein
VPAHFWHILLALTVVLVPAAIIVAFNRHDRAVMAQRAAGAAPRPSRQWPPRPTMALAAASAGAGLVHAFVCPEHFKEALSYGLFFALAASAQVAWAWLAWRGLTRRLLAWAALGNAAVLVLWAVTRTVGLPFGPAPGVAERVGGADVVAGLLELFVVVAAARAVAGAQPLAEACVD